MRRWLHGEFYHLGLGCVVSRRHTYVLEENRPSDAPRRRLSNVELRTFEITILYIYNDFAVVRRGNNMEGV